MSGRNTLAAVAVGLLAASASFAADAPAVSELANRLMQTTKVIAVTNLTDPAKFTPDSDPNTLQIVYITDPALGKSHVSDDGEVIWFFGNPNIDDQQAYIFKAFEIRAKLRQGTK